MRVSDLPKETQKRILGASHGSKYGNVKTEVGGIRFDSNKEASRFQELSLKQELGVITDLRLQVDFTLQEAYMTPEGERIAAIRYRADFTYWEDGKFVVEDVKSPATRTNPVYRQKYRLMADRGYHITEI